MAIISWWSDLSDNSCEYSLFSVGIIIIIIIVIQVQQTLHQTQTQAVRRVRAPWTGWVGGTYLPKLPMEM